MLPEFVVLNEGGAAGADHSDSVAAVLALSSVISPSDDPATELLVLADADEPDNSKLGVVDDELAASSDASLCFSRSFSSKVWNILVLASAYAASLSSSVGFFIGPSAPDPCAGVRPAAGLRGMILNAGAGGASAGTSTAIGRGGTRESIVGSSAIAFLAAVSVSGVTL